MVSSTHRTFRLNVSRSSYLQSDANVKKISTYITKKVADRLQQTFKNDRKDYEKSGTT
jgi:molecular chaperone HtpG